MANSSIVSARMAHGIDTTPCLALLPCRMLHGAKIHRQFESVALTRPDSVALREHCREWTYGEVNTSSDGLAVRLQALGASETSAPVAIYGKRAAWLVVSMLACSKAGRTFAVLDSAYPAARLRAQMDLVSPRIVIAVNASEAELKDKLGDLGNIRLVLVNDEATEEFNRLAHIAIAPVQNRLAYLLFTSGTTGLPKCIQTSHAPLIHFVEFYQQTFGPRLSDEFSMLSGLSHDPIFRDIFVPLSVGARLCIPVHSIITQPNLLFDWVAAQTISFLHATPQLLRLIIAGARGRTLPGLTHVF